MQSLKRRITRLAARTRATPTCPLCAQHDGAAVPGAGAGVFARVIFAGDEVDLGPERCPACGAQWVWRLQFDEPRAP